MPSNSYHHPEVVRRGVQLIKRKFAAWRDPPVETPADFVIEECVREIIEDALDEEAASRDRESFAD